MTEHEAELAQINRVKRCSEIWHERNAKKGQVFEYSGVGNGKTVHEKNIASIADTLHDKNEEENIKEVDEFVVDGGQGDQIFPLDFSGEGEFEL